jgi:hypothetical protein
MIAIATEKATLAHRIQLWDSCHQLAQETFILRCVPVGSFLDAIQTLD